MELSPGQRIWTCYEPGNTDFVPARIDLSMQEGQADPLLAIDVIISDDGCSTGGAAETPGGRIFQ